MKIKINLIKIRKFQLVSEIIENKGFFKVNIIKTIIFSKYKEYYKPAILNINNTMSYIYSEYVNYYY